MWVVFKFVELSKFSTIGLFLKAFAYFNGIEVNNTILALSQSRKNPQVQPLTIRMFLNTSAQKI